MKDTIHHARRPRRRHHLWLIVVAVMLALLLTAATLAAVWNQRVGHSGSGEPLSSGAVTVPTTGKTLPLSFINRNTASPYIILGNVTDNKVLYSKNENEKCYPASLTKLVTALVAMDYAAADTPITVGNEIYMIDPASSRAYLTVGTRLTKEQLLQALLLPSGNDAAYAMAVQVGRLIANDSALSNQAALDLFISKMNEKAASLGCTGTHFANPDGIHRDDHYTTAAGQMAPSNMARGMYL